MKAFLINNMINIHFAAHFMSPWDNTIISELLHIIILTPYLNIGILYIKHIK